jgi:hypothetical protein
VQLLTKKQAMSKELSYGQASDSYETKSNNLSVLRDEVMTALHSVVGKLDSVYSHLTSALQCFTIDNMNSVQLGIHLASVNP